MTRLAHLTDMHLNGSRERHARFKQGLDHARRWGASHLVLTGDLTESGRPLQYSEVAKAIADAGWPPYAVTIIPGNHDGGPLDWQKALEGTLRHYASTSRPGAVIDKGDVIIGAISTQIDQSWPMARGKVDERQLALLKRLATRSQFDPRPVIIAMHHPPIASPMGSFDELINRCDVLAAISGSNMHVLSGHDHRILDVGRVHTAGSVLDHEDPLRIYDVVGRDLVNVYKSSNQGRYLAVMSDALPPQHQLG
jgi:3',5'-cyclic AMP phosphodiesterase CpdA